MAQALLVQSALTAMSRQRATSNLEAQRAPAGEGQPSSGTDAAQLRAEYDADLTAAAEKAQEVGTLSRTHCTRCQKAKQLLPIEQVSKQPPNSPSLSHKAAAVPVSAAATAKACLKLLLHSTLWNVNCIRALICTIYNNRDLACSNNTSMLCNAAVRQSFAAAAGHAWSEREQ